MFGISFHQGGKKQEEAAYTKIFHFSLEIINKPVIYLKRESRLTMGASGSRQDVVISIIFMDGVNRDVRKGVAVEWVKIFIV